MEQRKRAKQRRQNAEKGKAEKKSRKEELENKLLTATKEEAAGMKIKIDKLEKGIAKDNKEMKEADMEEETAKQEEDDVNKMNVKDKVNNPIDVDPNKPL